MKKRSVRLFAAVTACCGLLSGAAALAETTVCDGAGVAGSGAGRISSVPFTISAPGVYCLTTKISSNLAGGAAITINANNVVLDLNSYAIGNLAAGTSTAAVGIEAVDRQNIVIRNGILRGFWAGIGLVNGTTVGLTTAASSGHLVEGITTDTCYAFGIALQGPFAVIRNNKVMNTRGSGVLATPTSKGNLGAGIYVEGPDAHVRGNTVLDTDCANGCMSTTTTPAVAVGIAVQGSPSSVVEDNVISNQAMPTVSGLGNGSASVAIDVASSGTAATTNVFVISNQMTNWESGIYYDPGSASKPAATGDFLLNGAQAVTTPYIGGTNINLTPPPTGSGMNF